MSPPSSKSGAAVRNGTVTMKRLVDVLLFVGPSGCGKTTIITQLQQEWPDLFEFSVSHTTRAPRNGEVDGTHYHFVSLEDFKALVNAGAMIEYSRLSSPASSSPSQETAGSKSVGNVYGTSKKALHTVLSNNKVVLMDTDLLGAIHMRRYCAHVVVDARPVMTSRAKTQATKATTTTAASAPVAAPPVAVNRRYVEVLPATITADRPDVVWRVPRLDVSAVQLKHYTALPAVPPALSMPNANRLMRCMVIFIAPPSMQVLEERLRERNSETEESFRMRMELNMQWMQWAQKNENFFDYYIVNDNLQLCYERVRKIVVEEVLAMTSSL
ncbi:guanylate kinase-like protein [Leptomonas pyrrhocoris]|uniref:Guanylate kinase-like protein n=1 Tax=Leptomonas pyrrhocoris TaxID=157538 RepID=A0A0M9G1C8_LEPPY|nr:guanylate kinase-like protein [Leptomonas pyrrhocoris]KPA80186.1 guanylate kinase-like protein [Leptomonas pyrrhocoris]|eukprot:XP_015658625.1 guanylate kinase-like protein [Leptomonas pyrrhocoris]